MSPQAEEYVTNACSRPEGQELYQTRHINL
jgi:hypothetical protein